MLRDFLTQGGGTESACLPAANGPGSNSSEAINAQLGCSMACRLMETLSGLTKRIPASPGLLGSSKPVRMGRGTEFSRLLLRQFAALGRALG